MTAKDSIQDSTEDAAQHLVTPAMVVAAKKAYEEKAKEAPDEKQSLEGAEANVKDAVIEKESPRDSLKDSKASARDALDKSASAQADIPEPPKRQSLSSSSYCKQEIDVIFDKAITLQQAGDLEEAVRGYNQVLSMDPNRVEAYNYMAEAERGRGKLDAAISCYKRSLAMRPDDPIIQSNFSDVLRDAGQLGNALAASQRAMKLAPKSPKAAYNMALVLRDLGQASSAVDCFMTALTLKPDMVECRYDHALSLLRIGNYKRGFSEFEWRRRLPGYPTREFPQPVWDGFDLTGKTIFIHHEQTLGDMIQFARYALLVKDKGGEVVIECQPELLRLFFTLPGADRVIAAGDKPPSFDVYAPMLSLPRIMGTTMKTIPGNVPYLSPPDSHDIRLGAPKGTRLKVGIVWGGSANNAYDRHRSCGLKNFLRLMDRPDIAFYSLQKGGAVKQIAENACEDLITNLDDRLNDFADTAAAISLLDLVITVDTAVAHLAGAMGQPVWVLLPFAAGWRWGAETSTSPWYPGDLLFRQSRSGHWEDVFAEVEKALRELVDSLS